MRVIGWNLDMCLVASNMFSVKFFTMERPFPHELYLGFPSSTHQWRVKACGRALHDFFSVHCWYGDTEIRCIVCTRDRLYGLAL